MKNHLSLSSSLAVFGAVLALQTGVAGAGFNPVALTPSSYTFGIVVPSNYVQAVPYCVNAFVGSGFCLSCDTTYYEQGLYTRPGFAGYNSGVPIHGTVFTNINDANMTFLMPPEYTTNNDLMIMNNTGSGNDYGAILSGTFTFSTPTTATSLAILDTGGNGGCMVNYTVTHADSSTNTGSINVPDWFSGGPAVAWGANGRIDENGNYSAYSGSADNNNFPYLYGQTIAVTSNSPVTSITFNYNSGNGVDNFFGVSAANGGFTYTPVPVTGFNVTAIVPASTPFPVTATMDNGTNLGNPGNTWFEQGYYINTAYGLPPSGSTFASLSQPTHTYQMGNYSANNAILIDVNHLSANITPSGPAAYYGFAFLTCGANIGGGQMTNVCILQHQDGVNETNLFYGYDWFNSSVPGALAYNANGRVNLNGRSFNNLGNITPNLFETYFALNDNTSPVTNIVVEYKLAPGANATTFIMAVSATTNPIAPIITSEPQPTYQAWFPGQTATLSVQVTGSQPLTNTWLVESNGVYVPLKDGVDANGSVISGSGTTTLTISDLTAADGANYEYAASNGGGSQTSTPAIISIKGKAGVVPIALWNNIANQTYTVGNSTNITSGDGSTSATLTLSGGGVNNAWNSGITGDGGNLSLMHGYIDAGNYGGMTASVAISGLTNSSYNVYIYCFPDQSRIAFLNGVFAQSNAVVIRGRENFISYFPSGELFTNFDLSFEVSLQDSRWLIKEEEGRPDTYRLTGFDGTNVYDYFVDASFTPPPGHSYLMNHLPGTICAGSMPLNSDSWTMSPWFAFCSGSLFENRKTGDLIPAPWSAPRVFAIDSIFEPEVTTFDNPPHLPKECKFRVSDALKTKLLSTNWANSTDKDEMRLQLKSYPRNFLGGEYRVISTTNFAGLEIPLEFECKRFIPSGNSNSWLGQEIEGTVESISSRHLDSTQPPIPAGKQIDVMDTRLRDLRARVNGFSYKITNGVWPVVVAPNIASAFRVRQGVVIVPASELQSIPVRRRGVWVTFLLLAFIPPALFFLFRKKF